MHRLRVILDSEEDVIRDIDMSAEASFKDLHTTIVKAFDLEEGEMASFFVSNEDWEQGEEISLVDFGALSGSEARLMETIQLQELLTQEGSKMIYVYDFLNLWTFYVDLIQIKESDSQETKILKVVGERPAEAPEKSMEIPEDPGQEDDLDFLSEEGDYFDVNLN